MNTLYAFIEQHDISYLRANYSRYVVDLNRPADGSLLYPGKMETALCPLHTFRGEALYKPGHEPSAAEVQRRIAHYWQPYHQHLAGELARRGPDMVTPSSGMRIPFPQKYRCCLQVYSAI